jgi:hypothetical protein
VFNVCCCIKNCPSAGCASAASTVCKDIDVFGKTYFIACTLN